MTKMKTIEIDGVVVNADDEIDEEELAAYVELERKHYRMAQSIDVKLDGDYVKIWVHTANKPFERIRRISGYLVGSLNKWNDAKRAEEKDRVKHSI